MISPAFADSPHPPPLGDFDGDSILNGSDACPHFTFPFDNGCSGPDTDKDGVPDSLEARGCVGSVEDYAGTLESTIPNVADGCSGSAPPDGDGDGVPDDTDNCPDDFNPTQTDTDGDGIGDACDAFPNDPDNDIDGDGVGGDTDNCPNIANADQSDRDGDGIGDVCDPTPDGEELKKSCAALEKVNKAEAKDKAQGKAIAKEKNNCN